MPTIAFAAPILPGKLESWLRFNQELQGSRSEARVQSRRRIGIVRESSYLQQTPGGDLAIVLFDSDEPERAMSEIARSDAPFDGWFRERVLELHGIDLAAPVDGPPSKEFLNWSDKTSDGPDSTEANKATYRAYVAEVWNRGNLAAMERYFTVDHLDHDAPPGQGPGLAGLNTTFAMFQRAFSDIDVSVDQQVAEGDKIVCRITFRGTHRDSFFGIPATGRRVAVKQIHILRFANGKMSEHWNNSDDLSMLRQLGVIPELSHG